MPDCRQRIEAEHEFLEAVPKARATIESVKK